MQNVKLYSYENELKTFNLNENELNEKRKNALKGGNDNCICFGCVCDGSTLSAGAIAKNMGPEQYSLSLKK